MSILNIVLRGPIVDEQRENTMTILELAYQTGLSPKWVAGTAGGEYHSACPVCGGTDRFYIQPNKQMNRCMGFYCCRQCGISGDALKFARQFLNLSFQEAAQAIGAHGIEKFSFGLERSYAPTVLQRPPNKWTTQATQYVLEAHKRLLHRKDTQESLAARGIPMKTIERYKLGWLDTNIFLQRTEWGLPEQKDSDGKSRMLWIPSGLLIPSFETNGDVVRLKVRRSMWKEGDSLPKYVAISGSMNGLTLIGSLNNKSVVVVESELDAYAIAGALGDAVTVVAVGSNIKNPDNVTDRLARQASKLLICHDNDEAGKKMLTKWQKLYSHAIAYPTPIGKDIGEAIEKGLDIRLWFN